MSIEDEELIYKLALHFIPGIGAVHAKSLISYLGGVSEIFKSSKKKILAVPGIGAQRCKAILDVENLKRAEKECINIRRNAIDILFYMDTNYPQRLKHFPNSPLLIYKKGNTKLNANRTVGIIGTRRPTPYGIEQCKFLIKQLKPFDVNIISGLAYGIDTIAHRAAVENDISTVAILGSGIDNIYPACNQNLALKMMQKGGIISEFALSTKPDRENFPRRNRIIAALSDVLIVVESAKKGGSMITAEFANEMSKDVFAIPGKLGEEMSEGCNHLIKTHKAHLISEVKDISYIAQWEFKSRQAKMPFTATLTESEKEIYQIITDHKSIGLDHIIVRTNQSLSDISSVLLNLEFNGLINSLPGKKYILASIF